MTREKLIEEVIIPKIREGLNDHIFSEKHTPESIVIITDYAECRQSIKIDLSNTEEYEEKG